MEEKVEQKEEEDPAGLTIPRRKKTTPPQSPIPRTM
jgi:hypothetical protein